MARPPRQAPQPPDSPCIGICHIDPARALCEGCDRSLDEIACWSRLDEAGRRAVWALLPARRAARQAAAAGLNGPATPPGSYPK